MRDIKRLFSAGSASLRETQKKRISRRDAEAQRKREKKEAYKIGFLSELRVPAGEQKRKSISRRGAENAEDLRDIKRLFSAGSASLRETKKKRISRRVFQRTLRLGRS